MDKLTLYLVLLILIFNPACKTIQHTYTDAPSAERIKVSSGEVSSHNGYRMFPNGKYRALNIFVNIIYDETPNRDPLKDEFDGIWPSATTKSINTHLPSYLSNFMDSDYHSYDRLTGNMTKLYFESSFGSLVILGDFMIMNIPQSDISNGKEGRDFDYRRLVNSVVDMINEEGFQTIFGHDSMSDYDQDNDGKLDFTQIFIRNPTNKGKSYNYGSKDIGDGLTGSSLNETIQLKDGQLSIGLYSYQGVGMQNIAEHLTGIVIHELSHNLLGDNGFHTSGGNHLGTSNQYTSTFMGLQRGYGLMGGGSLVSCNGYERWRLGWTSHQYNPEKIPVAALNANYEVVNTDLVQSKNKHTILLRDFVTYGDAVRIKLPYKGGPKASNQYLWLENHQVGRNNRLDYLAFSKSIPECRPGGTPGVYAYIQVGKDVLKGDRKEVFPASETDNLRIVSAEGNWDMQFNGEKWDCPKWGKRSVADYVMENSLSGANDQYWLFDTKDTDLIDVQKNGYLASIKEKNGTLHNVGSDIGDELDAFTSGSKLSISSNPTPSNLRTYYVQQHGGNVESVFSERNTDKIYITGLEIQFEEINSKAFGRLMKVDIAWNNYELNEDVRWTGNISIPEKLLIKEFTDLILDQNYTANIEKRDTYSNEFAKHTILTLETGSETILGENARVLLTNKSALVVEPNAELIIKKGAKVVVSVGSVIKLGKNAKLIIEEGGMLSIEKGAYALISPNVDLDTKNVEQALNIHSKVFFNTPLGSDIYEIESISSMAELN